MNIRAIWKPILFAGWAMAAAASGCDPDTDEGPPTNSANRAPVARAGADTTVTVGTPARLDGRKSYDPDTEDSLTFEWILASGPPQSHAQIAAAQSATSSFVPDEVGSYVARLKVSDGKVSARDEVAIAAVAAPPEPVVLDRHITSARTLSNVHSDPSAIDYRVTRGIEVRAALTIDPGVRIQFADTCYLAIMGISGGAGSLRAAGTPSEPIFLEGQSTRPGAWGGIVFQGSASPSNQLSRVEMAHASSLGIFSSRVVVADCTFRDGEWGIFCVDIPAYGRSDLTGFARNTFRGMKTPILIQDDLASYLDRSSDYGHAHGRNHIELFPSLGDRPQTLRFLGLPYYVHVLVAGSRLTIAPGVTILMSGDSGVISIDETGSIHAVGTPDSSITIRGEADTPGLWLSVYIQSPHPGNEIRHLTIANGGRNLRKGASLGRPALPPVLRSSVPEPDPIRGEAASRLARRLSVPGATLILTAESRLRMEHTTIRRSGGYGLMASGGGEKRFHANRFEENTLSPVICDPEMIGSLDPASRYDLDNGQGFIHVEVPGIGRIRGPQIWPALDLPFYFKPPVGTAFFVYVESALTIRPGARFLFNSGGLLSVERGASIRAVGTPDSLIVFEGVDATPGRWKGIRLISDSETNLFERCVIAHAGFEESVGARQNLRVEGYARVRHCRLTDGSGCGIRVVGTGRLDLDSPDTNEYRNCAGGDICTTAARASAR